MCVERETGEQEPLEPLELPAQPRARVRRAKGTPDRGSAQSPMPGDADSERGTFMTWSEGAWEFTVNMLSWFVAIGALVFVVAYVAFEALKARRKGRS
jgi:hypothetical protein